MLRRTKYLLAVVMVLLITVGTAFGIGLHYLRKFGRQMEIDSDPIASATFDVSKYGATLNYWKWSGLVDHFPTTIPSSAIKVHFATFPGYFRESGYVQLRMQMPRKEIAGILATARSNTWRIFGKRDPTLDRLKAGINDAFWFPGFYSSDVPTHDGFPDTYTIYVFNHGSDEGIEESHGIAISGATNEVIYWADGAPLMAPQNPPSSQPSLPASIAAAGRAG